MALMRAILREGVAVANAQGIPLEEEERWGVITALLKRAGASKSSMYQDVEQKRRTEIDVINGAIVDAGKRLGIATPHNQTMVWLVKSLEETFAKRRAA
jgi:2-dehydropantoate 2-reductase